MNFIDGHFCQKIKTGYSVCGDACLCERSPKGAVCVLCDGIGSGIYANIAAITCAQRLMELLRLGLPLRAASEMVAGSMHRARKENIPFSAFSAAVIRPDGHFTVYAYEAPSPVFIQDGTARVLSPRHYTFNHEVIGEFSGCFQTGDSLLLASDGVTQAGMGHGHGLGIGAEGIADFINRNHPEDVGALPEKIADFCASLSNGLHDDDTTLALLNCRPAVELTVLTGPPSKHSMDHDYAAALSKHPGKKIVCGATTANILSRELGIAVEPLDSYTSSETPPEYQMKGIDLSTEGAITLNQACNVLEDPLELFSGNSPVKRLCMLLKEADVIHFHIGTAVNDAHEDFLFKQVGIRVRRTTVDMIAEKLGGIGKLVTRQYY